MAKETHRNIIEFAQEDIWLTRAQQFTGNFFALSI